MSVNYQLRIAVCDDMPSDRRVLIGMINKYLDLRDYLVEMNEYTSGEELLSSGLSYDLVFLDIYMGELNGIQTAERLNQRCPGVQIILCSTSNEFGAESYDVSAFRYLIKPLSEEKLFATLDRYFHAHTSMRMLTYKQNRISESVYLSDVLWIEADNHSSIIHTNNGNIESTTSLAQFWEELKELDFIKPIRYALVALSAVATPPGDEIKLKDGTAIPVSRKMKPAVKQVYMDYKMKLLLQKGGLR